MKKRRRRPFHGTRVLCVRVTPTAGDRWEVTYALHPGFDVHDTTVCAGERFSMVRLVEEQGRCGLCKCVGVVLRERDGDGGLALCPLCTTMTARVVLRQAMAAKETADGVWRR
jgi:hypothetical protein